MKKTFLSLLIGVLMITTCGIALADVSQAIIKDSSGADFYPGLPRICTSAQMADPYKIGPMRITEENDIGIYSYTAFYSYIKDSSASYCMQKNTLTVKYKKQS